MIYVLHFEQPLAHARHYIGFTQGSWSYRLRLAHHRAGSGARLMAAVGKAGIRWQPVLTLPGGRCEERRLKDRKDVGKRLCPVCTGRRLVCFDCGRLYRHPGWLRRHHAQTGHS